MPDTKEQKPNGPVVHDPAVTPELPDMPPSYRQPNMNVTQVSGDPNIVSGLGKYLGPVAQFGAVGLMGLILWNMQSNNIQQTRESHVDTMNIINKSLDRLDANQTESQRKFESIQTDSQRKDDKNSEKFDAMGKEIKEGRKEYTESISKTLDEVKVGRKEMGDKLDAMLKKMNP
jgi:hypothetical protein